VHSMWWRLSCQFQKIYCSQTTPKVHKYESRHPFTREFNKVQPTSAYISQLGNNEQHSFSENTIGKPSSNATPGHSYSDTVTSLNLPNSLKRVSPSWNLPFFDFSRTCSISSYINYISPYNSYKQNFNQKLHLI